MAPRDKGEAEARADSRPHCARNIPWGAVVKFHREIAARAEEGFFSLRGDNDQDERWTSIQAFEPHDLAGGWIVSRPNIRSQPFRLELEQRRGESMFLGGPCYLAWEKGDRGAWFARWRPILYREVRVEAAGNAYRLIPEQAHWSLSPLVYSLIDQRQITSPVPLDRLVDVIVEKAGTLIRSADVTPHEAVTRAVLGLLPDLKEDLTREVKPNHFPVEPTPWVLFAPTTSFSALTRNLMRDYEELERLLERNPDEIGGLALLEEREAPPRQDADDVLPVVPLNDSQRSAVKAILGNRPITVVSGPPGCGKSQVVVSVLLNCWARGQSVLFASNNNKAVDVVRERLERFEGQFPIAVRAGNKQVNNVLEVLRRTLNMGRDGSTETNPQTFRLRRAKEEQERARLERFLRDGLPSRIDEIFKSALNAYSESRRINAELSDRETGLRKEFETLRLVGISPDGARQAVGATRAWIDQIPAVESAIREDEQIRSRLALEAAQATRARNESLGRIDLAVGPGDRCAWLLTGPQPTLVAAWLDRLRSELLAPIDPALETVPWNPTFDRWPSSERAGSVSADSRKLAEDLRACIARTAADFHELEALRRERDGVLRDAIEAGVEADVSVNPETLRAWASAWAEQCAVQESWTDWLPWSARARLARHLRLIERELRPCLSLAVWSRIGTLDDVGRGKLATVVERAARWLKVLARWHEAEPRRVAVARQYTELRSRAAQLELGSVPTTDSPEDWQPLVAEFDRLAREAAAATGAWKRREQQLALQARITRIAAEWNALASGVPAKDTWCDHAGASFDRAIRALASTPDLENVKRVRTEIYSASLAGLLEAWGAAIEHQRVATSAQESLGRVSTAESRIAGWWEGRSAQSVVVMKPSTGLPPPQILASADARMAEVTMWCDRWEKFWREEEPELSGRSRKEFAYASERLLGLVDMLPAGSDKDRFSRSVEKITDGEWHVEELRKSLERFDPDRIRAKIAQFDAQLERASFDDAKANWLERLRSDQEAIRAVNELERVLSRQRVECKPEQLPLFREALRLVPIWITTAQASQAIPIDAELFDLVVIDEASQCTLTNLLPLLFRGKRLAIIGDAEQLPAIPTIQETEQLALAKKYAVEGFLTIVGHAANDVYKSATETLPRRRADVLMLDEHYRSHPQIIGFSNQHIYQHRLQLLKPPTKDTALPFGMGVHRVSVMGIAERGERGRSWINEPEAEAVIELLQKLRATGGGPRTVGVVTPFAAQKMLLRNRLEQLGIASEVLVDTAYGFQGDERDVIIFSPVVAKGIEPASAQWVESPPNLVNVALTRARDALFVVADFDALAAQKGVLGKLARYCKDIQTLRDSSPAELALFSWMTLEGWAPSVHPIIGDHEADFVLKDDSRGTRLAIEVDGAQHRNSPEADAAIDAYLEGKGYQVLRLPARLVLESPHDVIHQIRQALKN